ncbi:MAG: metalloregulator ArsR/SmtB family transcription factor [Victivallaceae bacterium]
MKDVLSITKALSDRNRLRLVLALMEHGELCACQLTELLQVSGATASRHLALLTNAGLLDSRKSGRWVYFKLKPDSSNESIFKWLADSLQDSPDKLADSKAMAEITAYNQEDICRKQRGVACCVEKSSSPKKD